VLLAPERLKALQMREHMVVHTLRGDQGCGGRGSGGRGSGGRCSANGQQSGN
jgi:hypothetical protein